MSEQPIPHDAQITPAHVLEAVTEFKAEVLPRLDALEGGVAELKETVANAGLNGHTPLLKAFLDQYGATYVRNQAWLTVRADIRRRLRFLAPSKRWLAIVAAGALGAIGWQLVQALHLPIL